MAPFFITAFLILVALVVAGFGVYCWAYTRNHEPFEQGYKDDRET